MRFYVLLYLVGIFLLPFFGLSQSDTSLILSKEKWNEISNEIDYTETYFEKKEKAKVLPLKNQSSKDFFSSFKYVIYFLSLGLILFVIFLLIRNFKKNTTVHQTLISIDTIYDIEEKLHEINLDDLLKEAIAKKDYRIALRLNFLIIIKLLTQKGRINWAKEKTNWEYYSELNDKLLADRFREIIQSFEAVWYGEQNLTESQYYQIEPIYKSLQMNLISDEQE